jgi:hypothetical protein
MSYQERKRLERLEAFVERLTLGSYIAKAADTGSRIMGQRLDEGDTELATAVRAGGRDQRLNRLENHLQSLEARYSSLALGSTPAAPSAVAQGEDVLAKAAGVYNDPEALLALGDREISDPVQMGAFSGHIWAGDLESARNMLIDIRERMHVAKAADVAQEVSAALTAPEPAPDLGVVLERFGQLERLFAAFQTRLDRLEGRPRATAPMQGQTVAKAAGGGGKRKRSKAEVETDLLHRIDLYIDSPTVAGSLSSLITAGQYAQVDETLQQAQRTHEARKAQQERRSWQ